MARRLRFFREQMTKAGISPSRRSTEETEVDLDNLEVVMLSIVIAIICYKFQYHVMEHSFHDQVKLAELEAELQEINVNNEELQHSYRELLEYELVLHQVWL